MQLSINLSRIGLINPITVQKSGDEYIIIAGERRYEACKTLNMAEIPCLVITATAEQESLIMLSENLQRKDLSEVEKADAIWEYKMESDFPVRQIADKLGVTHTYLNNLLSLHGFPDEVKQMVKNGDIAANTTMPLKQLPSDTEKIKVAEYIADIAIIVK